MLCILYTITVGTGLGIAGLLLERAMPPGWPRRWVWCITISLSMIIPPLYRSQHTSTVVATSQTTGDPTWWVRIGSYDPVVMQLWGIVSVLLIIGGLVSVVRVSIMVRRSQSDRNEATIIDGVPVAVTDSLGPASVGLWRSRVVIPRWVLGLPRAQRQYVLRHEEEHRRAHDTRVLFLSSLVLVLVPWNLPLWWQLRWLSLAVEMDCDRRVVAALGDAPMYGELLLDIAQATSRSPRLQPAFLGGIGSLERRLTELLAPAQMSRVQRYVLPAIAIALLFAVLLMPHPMRPDQLAAHHSVKHATR